MCIAASGCCFSTRLLKERCRAVAAARYGRRGPPQRATCGVALPPAQVKAYLADTLMYHGNVKALSGNEILKVGDYRSEQAS
jgi:hypothetical protein